MIKCSFCGHYFFKEEALTSCNGCPFKAACNKTKCPRCGYEMPQETGLIKWLGRKKGERNHAK